MAGGCEQRRTRWSCTARRPGCRNVAPVPIWAPDAIRLQAIRAGFPCFAGALTGYVEATRVADEEKNRLCPATAYANSLADWAAMTARGARAAATYGAEPDIAEWAQRCLLNPARVGPGHRDRPEVLAAQQRVAEHAAPGIARLAELARI